MNVKELQILLSHLANKRKCFHSEADFQHALAWEVDKSRYEVRLGVPKMIDDDKAHIDIQIKNASGKFCFLELKYKTAKGIFIDNNETFNLKNHGAEDFSRQDFIKDIWRLESLSPSHGYAIFLTNEGLYWDQRRMRGGNADAFRIHQGKILENNFAFRDPDRDGTPDKRRDAIKLRNRYVCSWELYSNPGCEFKFLIVPVGKEV